MNDNKSMNSISNFKDVNRRERKDKDKEKKEERGIMGSSLEKKINSINKEIEKMKTDEILLNVDPEVEAIEAVEQIQSYYNLIKMEISKIVKIYFLKIFDFYFISYFLSLIFPICSFASNSIHHNSLFFYCFLYQKFNFCLIKIKNKKVNEEKSLLKDIIEQEERMEDLFKPKKINYDFKNLSNNENNGERRKPVIDYKIKIKNLENDIHLTSQNYDDTKAKNELLRRELDEMRKSVTIRREKVDNLYNELLLFERDFKEDKRRIESELANRKTSVLEEINAKTSELAEKNMDMIEKIKKNDEKVTKILSKKKHIEHEKIKLTEKMRKIQNYWLIKNEEFLRGKKEELAKLNNNDDTNKVLDLLSGEKLDSYREIVAKLYQGDADEDDVNKISRLLEYFINSTKEVIS